MMREQITEMVLQRKTSLFSCTVQLTIVFQIFESTTIMNEISTHGITAGQSNLVQKIV